MEGIIPSIAAAVATEQPGEREAGIHAPHSGDGGGTVLDDRQLAAIRRAASKIAEQLARGLARLLSMLSPRLWDWMISIRRISRTYHARHGFYPSLIHPVRYTEKVQWRKLFDLNSTYSVLCDKVDSRDFIRERIGPEVLVTLLWAGEIRTQYRSMRSNLPISSRAAMRRDMRSLSNPGRPSTSGPFAELRGPGWAHVTERLSTSWAMCMCRTGFWWRSSC